MADNNPANFANLPRDRVQEIASMGGKASHKGDDKEQETPETHIGVKAADDPGRNADGTFKPGSDTAKELGQIGGKNSHINDDKKPEHGMEETDNGRNPDGTFKPGSEAAKVAGEKGGKVAAEK